MQHSGIGGFGKWDGLLIYSVLKNQFQKGVGIQAIKNFETSYLCVG